jgi:hypothetical protein
MYLCNLYNPNPVAEIHQTALVHEAHFLAWPPVCVHFSVSSFPSVVTSPRWLVAKPPGPVASTVAVRPFVACFYIATPLLSYLVLSSTD